MIVIVDYKAGNLTSVKLAFEALHIETCVTSDPQVIASAERIIFPGVGAAQAAMNSLKQLGLEQVLKERVAQQIPFLGICIGMQVLFESSEEDGGTNCLGLLAGEVKQFCPADRLCKIPHMGWNNVEFNRSHPLLAGIESKSEFYFVHSFYPSPADTDLILGKTEYAGISFASIAAKANVVATQFHPERSGRVGLELLKNFCGWNGKC